MLESINAALLAEYVGKQFEVLDDPAQTFFVTLTRIIEHAKTERQETFSIYFQGPADPRLLQGIHKLRHAGLGEVSLFLVPIGQDKDGLQYEAVFNRVTR